jgi:radical SAM superfamily enzyme YgiQ (UPF0313 family)
MKTAGCYRITFGIESGSKRIRQFIGKPYPLSQAKELIKYANKIGMWTITTNIIGLPYETLESIEKTVRFAITCGTDFACFYKLIPHKDTKVYQYRDQITVTDKELDSIQRSAYRRFLLSRIPLSPFRLLNKVRSWEDLRYMLKLTRLGFKILLNTFKKKGHILYD